VKPVVAVDIDGTLGDYHSHFLDFAVDYLNVEIPFNYNGDIRFKDWFLNTTGESERTWYDIKLTYRQGAQKRTMPIYPFAKELCDTVLNQEAELWITTTRPFQRLDNIDPDTRNWLDRHDIVGYTGLIYDEDKYHRLREIVGPDRVCAVLDDLIGAIHEAHIYFGPKVPILRQTDWNIAIDYPRAALNLTQASNMITNRIESWYAYDQGSVPNHAG